MSKKNKKNKKNTGPLEINIPMEMEDDITTDIDFIKKNVGQSVEKSDGLAELIDFIKKIGKKFVEENSDGLAELKDIIEGTTDISKVMKSMACSLFESMVPEDKLNEELKGSFKNNVTKFVEENSDGLAELKSLIKGKTSITKLMKEKTCSLLENGVPEENMSMEISKSFKKIGELFVNDLKKSDSEICEIRVERFSKLVLTEISEGSDYIGMFLKEFPMLSKEAMFSISDEMLKVSLLLYPDQPKIDVGKLVEELKKVIPSPNKKQACA